jgi:DNA-binding MarR family transcriptional regulator
LILFRHISEEPGVPVSELARRSGLVKSHVSKMIEQLVQQGYVEKRTDPTDHRLLRIYRTENAPGTMSEMEARAHEVWSSIMAELPEEQLEDVVRGLRVLLMALEKSTRKTDPN